MVFILSKEAKQTSEKSIGRSSMILRKMRLKDFCATLKPVQKTQSNFRFVKSRGSLYLQLGRKVSMRNKERIIQDF